MHSKRCVVFRNIAIVIGILFFICGIVLGIDVGERIREDFSWGTAWLTWLSAVVPIIPLYAVYVHIDIQEDQLRYLIKVSDKLNAMQADTKLLASSLSKSIDTAPNGTNNQRTEIN